MKITGFTTEDELLVSLTTTDFNVLYELLKKHQLKNNAIHQVLLEDFEEAIKLLEGEEEND